MVVHSIANNSYVPLASGASFEGGIEVTTQGVSICVSTFCSSEVKVIIKQYRQNAASTLMHSNEENAAADTKGLVQTPVKAGFFSIKVENLGSNMTFTNITTVLQETHYLNLDIRSLNSSRDSVTIAGGSIDISGVQDVVITGRSGTGFLSYLNDNVAVATMPAITGTVAVSSQPHLSYLTDNVAVATMPAITGTVAVSSMPFLSYTTSNIAVATQPALAFSTDKVDATGSAVTISSGSVGVTGSVAVTNADITSIKTNTARFGLAIGSNYAEGIIQTYTNLSITGGYLYNLNVYSDGSNGTNFLKVYGVANATNADIPLLIVPIDHATSVNLSLSGLKALTGISVRATANYTVADNNAPTNGINCNLIFSPLV